MDSYISKYSTLLKWMACFGLLMGALLFASPANSATTREVNPVNPLANVAQPVELAYGYRYRYHRGYWHRGYGYRGWHRGYGYRGWHRRHYWRRW